MAHGKMIYESSKHMDLLHFFAFILKWLLFYLGYDILIL